MNSMLLVIGVIVGGVAGIGYMAYRIIKGIIYCIKGTGKKVKVRFTK